MRFSRNYFFQPSWHEISSSIHPIDFKFGMNLPDISLYHPYLRHCKISISTIKKKLKTLKKIGQKFNFFQSPLKKKFSLVLALMTFLMMIKISFIYVSVEWEFWNYVNRFNPFSTAIFSGP